MRLGAEREAITSLPSNLATSRTRLETFDRNRTVTAYSHTRVSDVRVVETVLVPRLAVITTRPEHPCVGDTVVGRRRVPLARKE